MISLQAHSRVQLQQERINSLQSVTLRDTERLTKSTRAYLYNIA